MRIVLGLGVSGGLDSTIAFYYYLKQGRRPTPIYVKLGHRYQEAELKALSRISSIDPRFRPVVLDNLRLGDFEWTPTDPKHPAYIPLRNMYLAMLMYNYLAKQHPDAELIEVAIIGVKGDRSPDKSPEAYEAMTRCINSIVHNYEPKIRVTSPFWWMTKGKLVRWFLENHSESFAVSVLRATFSCYSPIDGEPCGHCPACFRRWVALEYAGIEARDWFVNDPATWDGVKRYVERIKHGVYDPERAEEMIHVLKKHGLWGR